MKRQIQTTNMDKQSESLSKMPKRTPNRKRRNGNVQIINKLSPNRSDNYSPSVEMDINLDDLEVKYPIDIDLSEYQLTRDELIQSIKRRREYQKINDDVWEIIMDLTVGVVVDTGLKKITDVEYMERVNYLRYQSYFNDMYYTACQPFDHIIYPVELCSRCYSPHCDKCKIYDFNKYEDMDDRNNLSDDSSDDESYDEFGWW